MYLSYTRQNSTLIIILYTMWYAFWFLCDYSFFIGLCYVIYCFFVCVSECWSMYLCEFDHECVRIRTSKCVFNGVLAFVVVLLMCLNRLTEIPSIVGTTSDVQLHRHRQHRSLKNGWISHLSPQQQRHDQKQGQTESKQKQQHTKTTTDNHNAKWIHYNIKSIKLTNCMLL